MYKRRIKKLAFGDYTDTNGQSNNYITQGANYTQLASPLVNVVDPQNSYGVRSNVGAATSGLLKGAGMGATLGPIGAGIGGAIGLVGGILGNNKRKEEEAEAKKRQEQSEINNITQYSKGVLSTYPSYGITAKYGMKMPNGGKMPYPTTVDADHEVLSSNIVQYSGDTHEEGGIPLDNNIEIEDQEVIKDNMVLSDRLYPSKIAKSLVKGLGTTIKNNDTYATLSARLGKNKGKFEEKLTSTRLGEKGTAQLMTKQLNDAVNLLFKDQQLQKQISGVENKKEFQDGGELPYKQPASATKLYDQYDKELAKAYTAKYGPGFSFTDRSQAYLGFKDNNSYIPEMLVKSTVSSPSINYGKVYKFNDHTQDGYSVMNALREDGYLPKDKTMKAYGGFLDGVSFINGKPYKKSGSRFNAVPIEPDLGFAPTNGGTIDTIQPEIKTTQLEKIGIGEKIDNNLGNIANGIGFLANNAMINKLETEYNPTLTKAPNYNFNSRLPYLTNQVKSAFRTASQGINGSSAQDNQTLKSNLFAKTLSSINEATSDEFARKDQYDARYNEMSNRTNLINTGSINQAKFASQDNRNQKVALKQQNIDSLIKGIIGNKTVKDQQELDFAKNYMELLKGDQTGVSKRFLDQVPAKFRRKYIGNYYNP